jgi:GMP synthase-like glutamine amidotransferase
MNIHVLQHVEFEDIGTIREWIEKKPHTLSYTRLFDHDAMPALSTVDALVIMGGPMSANDANEYVWLADELGFIKEAIDAGKKVLGICLGAQLIAKTLGANVYKSSQKEIGWFPVTFEAGHHELFPALSPKNELTVFQWHGETFDLPEGSKLLFSSAACKNQAFVFGTNVVSLQFHIEMSEEAVARIVRNCRNELVAGTYIQSETEIRSGFAANSMKTKKMLFDLLDRFFTI